MDVIVVGARVAGAATAMLLARAGCRVLLLDRSRFPSDTLSSHQVQLPGVARLHRWGLLDALQATGVAPVRSIRFTLGDTVMAGTFAMHDGVDALYSPRRTVLDALLIDAAVAAGAELRTGIDVDELITERGRVTGVRGRERGRGTTAMAERASLVIGADGKHSTIARLTGAPHYRIRPASALACYSYWSGLPADVGELRQLRGATIAMFPTNDALTMLYLAVPRSELDRFRADPLAAYLATLPGDLAERVRAADRAERIRLAPDQPNFFARPYGPGWALVGDAGLSMDSITAQGISNALCDAEALAGAVIAGGDSALSAYHRDRDRRVRAMYGFTVDLASFPPPSPTAALLFRTIAGDPVEVSRFMAAFAGAEPIGAYFGARSMVRLIGPRATLRAAGERLRRITPP
ncbi:MAG TPA: NAD(P)/FAD-dependent oxidoreductase [Micromonosporaceae bacterium]|jgi:2-polyprenyl-6-methoxyphenol hydroxylase-like FAD-dependent oxidoreductase